MALVNHAYAVMPAAGQNITNTAYASFVQKAGTFSPTAKPPQWRIPPPVHRAATAIPNWDLGR